MARVRLVTTEPPLHRRLAEADSRGDLYLHPRWLRAITRAYPTMEPRWLILEEGGRDVGVLPFVRERRRGLVQVASLPFGTYGGPLLAPEATEGGLRALLAAFRDHASGVRVVRMELTVFRPSSPCETALESVLGIWRRPMETHWIDLSRGFEPLWTREFDKEVRTCARKAEREGVTVAEETDERGIADLHALHVELGRGWEGAAPHSLSALRAVWDALGEDARVWMARRDGRPLAGNLTLYHRHRVYPWVAGATGEARRYRANHLLNVRMLQDACTRGYRTWNFGGSAGNPGIAAFKVSLGARPHPVHRYFREAGWRSRLRRGRTVP